MTDEELKKLAEEYRQGLLQVDEVKEENEMLSTLDEDECARLLAKQLQDALDDAAKHPVNIQPNKK